MEEVDKKELKVLKAQRTKLLNKQVENEAEFEDIQERLNEVELKIKMIKKKV